MFEVLLYVIHGIVCLVLILVVLLQSGKAADLAGAFGGGGSQTALGSRGAATVLSKATSICAIVFMLSSLGLAIFGSRSGGSVLEQVPLPAAPAESPAAAPVTPGANPPAQAPAPQGSAPAEGQPAPSGSEQKPQDKPAGGGQ
ncbi:MAG TPA: preprotein translocase subunit SecG [Candidatus Polarisedimenticolia bacterium]|nr:preprotein translocase subunit SecG [Candidatus Polarisedimenticolia bacterium]